MQEQEQEQYQEQEQGREHEQEHEQEQKQDHESMSRSRSKSKRKSKSKSRVIPSPTSPLLFFLRYSQALHEGGVAGAVEGLAHKGGAFPLWGAWECWHGGRVGLGYGWGDVMGVGLREEEQVHVPGQEREQHQ